MPCRYLFEIVRAAILTHLVLGGPRVDPHWAKLILIGVIADLAKIVRSTGPELTSIALSWVVGEEHGVVLATTDLMNGHAFQIRHNLSWLNDSIPIGIAKA